MKSIIDSEGIKVNSASYVVDLIKATDGELTIDILQTKDTYSGQIKNITIEELTELIAKLQQFYAIMNVVKPTTKKHIDTKKGKKIVTYYFKDVPIKDIARLLDITQAMVKDELTKQGIEIVTPKPKSKGKYRHR